jgi:hypothetical protein
MACLLAMSLSLYSQEQRPFRHYATQQVHRQLLEQHPDFAPALQGQEKFILDYGLAGDNRVDQIAVVFHVLYQEGMPYPGLEHVNAALDALNRDFGPYVPPATPYESAKFQEFEALAKDPLISFCLPLAIGGADLKGVVRFVETSVGEWEPGDGMKSGLTEGDDPLDPSQYLNIWVCQLKGNAAGNAQMPGGPNATDGIVIDYDYLPGFGADGESPYKDGKALTHLVGNYLGLYELWNELNHCGDDGVADTPIHNAPNFEMPAPGVRHISGCPMGPVDEMVMNFMDNTDDASQNMFTAGQKARMKAILSAHGPRAGLAAAATQCSGQGLIGGESGAKGKKITTQNGTNKLKLFPNPTKGAITLKIESSAPSVAIAVYNDFGERMLGTHSPVNGGQQTVKLNCEGWSPGLYTVSLSFADGSSMNTVFSIIR